MNSILTHPSTLSANRMGRRLFTAAILLAFTAWWNAGHAMADDPEAAAKSSSQAKSSTQATSSPQATGDSDKPKESVVTLAGGCFWCTEAVFERMKGVNDVVSGYIGGHVPNPTYEQVCGKKTGHAEAVEVYYDPDKISYDELLEIFFKTHDPTTLNRQGADEGPQYRSSIFFHSEEERVAAKKFIRKLDASGKFRSRIVTKLERATEFYPAEEYHQDYFRLNPNAQYCQYVVRGKVLKAQKEFSDKLKETQP